MDADEDLVVAGHGALDLLEPQHVGRPVPVEDDSFHALTVRTTFPVFCNVSTYLAASTTSSSG